MVPLTNYTLGDEFERFMAQINFYNLTLYCKKVAA